MLQPRRDATATLGAERGHQFRTEHLHRDLALVLDVLGEIHRGHAAATELPLQAVAVGEGRGETIPGLIHSDQPFPMAALVRAGGHGRPPIEHQVNPARG